jgi:FkbM family methyltransferase
MSIRANPLWAGLMHSLRVVRKLIPERLYRHLWFHGGFDANIEGARFRMNHPGNVLENQLFWRDNFEGERTAVAAIGAYIDRADTFLDVGANSGFYGLYAKARKPGINVLAFEPSPVNLALLRQNIAMNGFDIETFEAAVTDKDGDVTLYDFDEHSYSASLVEDFRPGTVARTVPGLTLDTIAERYGLLSKKLLIKVDVEGHEAAVLEGANRVIGTDPTFLIEILTDDAATAVSRLLSPSRFSYIFADEASGKTISVTSKVAAGGHTLHGNYFVIPIERP